jgi:hypothetical protein
MEWNRERTLGALACMLAVGAAGCAPVELRKPVTVVPTSTPGVAYVLVQPVTWKDRDDADPELAETDRNSDYILLCDARYGDGMRCAVAPEVSRSRFSEHRPIVKSGKAFNFGTAVGEGIKVETGPAATPPAGPPGQPGPGAVR